MDKIINKLMDEIEEYVIEVGDEERIFITRQLKLAYIEGELKAMGDALERLTSNKSNK